MSETIIIAPHCDDEIIGCFSLLENPKIKPVIIYTEDCEKFRQEEASKIKEHFSIRGQLYCKSIPPQFINHENTFYFPGPDEIHPAHRKQAAIGEELARKGYNVIFYTTNMNVPYIREVKEATNKKVALDTIYGSQYKLWKYEHKFFLFEGFCKWFF